MHLLIRHRCPACGEAGRRAVASTQFTRPDLVDFVRRGFPGLPQGRLEEVTRGHEFAVARCAGCDLFYQVAVPDDDLIHEIYDRWSDADASRAKARRKTDGGRAAKLLQDALILVSLSGRPPSALRALDYGAGWGGWCTAARAVGIEIAAYELGVERVEGLRADGIRVLSEAELATERFDLINAEQVFEHLVDPAAAMARLAHALTPGGVLRIAVPGVRWLGAALRRMDWTATRDSIWSLMAMAPLDHLNGFPARALAALGRAAGLERIRPGMRADYAHLIAAGSLAKAMLRPLYMRALGRDLTVHFRRPA